MQGDAPIGEDEVRDLILGFYRTVHMGGPMAALEPMFVPGAVIETWFGARCGLDLYLEVHAGLTRERHTLLDMTLVPLTGDRVRVIGDVEWEAVIVETGAIIEAVIASDWLIERAEDGRLRFARCASVDIRYLPGSAPLEV